MQIESFIETQTIGHAFIPNAVPLEECQKLISEIKYFPLRQVAEYYNGVKQDFEYQRFTLDQIQHCSDLMTFLDRYSQVYNKAAKLLSYCPSSFQVAFNHYQIGGRIGSHRDESHYRNIISIFTLSGETPFHVGPERSTTSHSYQMLPGSLLLMRAPRSVEEKPLRPFHAVGPAVSERYAIVIRHEVPHGQNPNPPS